MDLARAVQPLAYVLAPVLIYQGKGLRQRSPAVASGVGLGGVAATSAGAVRAL